MKPAKCSKALIWSLQEGTHALKTGEVAVWLLKPVSFPLYVIVSELGRSLFRLVFLALPTVVVVALIYGMAVKVALPQSSRK